MARGSLTQEFDQDKQCPQCRKWYADVRRHLPNCRVLLVATPASRPPRETTRPAAAPRQSEVPRRTVVVPPTEAPKVWQEPVRSRDAVLLDTPAFFAQDAESPPAHVDATAGAAAVRVVFSPSAFASFDTFLCPRQLRLHCRPKLETTPRVRPEGDDVMMSASTRTKERGNAFEARVFQSIGAFAGRPACTTQFVDLSAKRAHPTSAQEALDAVTAIFDKDPKVQHVLVAQLPVMAPASEAWSWWCSALGDEAALVKMGTMYLDLVRFTRLTDVDAVTQGLEQLTVKEAEEGCSKVAKKTGARLSVTIADIKSSVHGIKRSHCLQIAYYALVLKALWGGGSHVRFNDHGEVWLDPAALTQPTTDHQTTNEHDACVVSFALEAQQELVRTFLAEVLGPLVAKPVHDLEDVPAQRFQPESSCSLCEHRFDCKALARQKQDSFALLGRPAPDVSHTYRAPTSARVETLQAYIRSDATPAASRDEAVAKQTSLKNGGSWVQVGPLSTRPLCDANCVKTIDRDTTVLLFASKEGRYAWRRFNETRVDTGALSDGLEDAIKAASTVIVWNQGQLKLLLDECRRLDDPGLFKALATTFDADVTPSTTLTHRKQVLRLQDVINAVVETAVPRSCLDIDDLRTATERSSLVSRDVRLWTAADVVYAAEHHARMSRDVAAQVFDVIARAVNVVLTTCTKLLRHPLVLTQTPLPGVMPNSGVAAVSDILLDATRRQALLGIWSTRRSFGGTDNVPPAVFDLVKHDKPFALRGAAWYRLTNHLLLPHQHASSLRDAIASAYPSLDSTTDKALTQLGNGFLTCPYWVVTFSMSDTASVNVVAALNAKTKMDESKYCELPFKLGRLATHILGYRRDPRSGDVEILAVVDDKAPPSSMLIGARANDFNHAATAAAVGSIAKKCSVSVLESLCAEAPRPLPEQHHWDAPSADQLRGLNAQQAAVLCSVCTRRCTILWGPPGTGKTSTLAKVLRFALEQNKRVAVLTLTHAAKREVVAKMEALLNWVLSCVDLTKAKEEGREALKYTADSSASGYVVFATPQGLAKCRMKGFVDVAEIDLFVVDEASQMTLPLALLATATPGATLRDDVRIMVAGDVLQLPPIVPSCIEESEVLQRATMSGVRCLTRSVIEALLFDRNGRRFAARDLVPVQGARRVEFPDHLIMLNVNYRSCQSIVNFVSTIYPGLQHGPQDSFAQRENAAPPLQRFVLRGAPVTMDALRSEPTLRRDERVLVVRYLQHIARTCPRDWTVAVVTPHRLQRSDFNVALASDDMINADKVTVDTVECMQGKEFDVVVVALGCVSAPFALQLNRLNVALSRAKRQLLVVTTNTFIHPSAADFATLTVEARSALGYLQRYWNTAADWAEA